MIRSALLLPALLLLPSPAFACGGMFCDSVAPVDQAAERIVFAWDADGDGSGMGTITTEVQISFSGESDDFAWVIPVPDVPELFTSNDALFTTLANNSIPSFQLTTEFFGECEFAPNAEMAYDAGASYSAADTDRGGVSVVAEQTVGPYDTVILEATDSAVLVGWLQDQGYSIPGNIEPVVRPYVAANQYFVALRLSSDRSTGDLAPLGMRYRGTAASIPIQLTSVAATPDLPIEAFILGPSRAVPDNYLHVRINEAAIDWYGGGLNYRDVVKQAADEAGGQAFVTDYAGPTGFLDGRLWTPGMADLDYLSGLSDPIAWLDAIVYSGIPSSSQLTNLLTSIVPPPEGVDATTFLSCPDCYADDISVEGFDPVAATERVDTEVFQILAAEQEMISGAPVLTRLFTTMDAAEMTVDPLFVFNADLPQTVDLTHFATNEVHCGLFEGDGAERVLALSDGRRISLPSEEWVQDHETTEYALMEELTSPAAIVIEDLSATGEGTILFDYREDAAKAADQFDAAGCGCSTNHAGAPVVPGLLLAAGLLARRRRA